MRIYKLKSEIEKFLWLYTPKREDRLYKINNFNGKSMEKNWNPISVEHLLENEKDKRLLIGDCPKFSLGPPVFSKKATKALRDLLKPYGEILSLESKDGEYYAYNVLQIIDALDEEKSIVERFDDGDIFEVIQYVFNEKLLHEAVIFKIPQFEKIVYVTEKFIQRVRDEELLGFKFVEIYPHTPDPKAWLKNLGKKKHG